LFGYQGLRFLVLEVIGGLVIGCLLLASFDYGSNVGIPFLVLENWDETGLRHYGVMGLLGGMKS